VALGYVSAQAAADAYGVEADQPADRSERTQ
jgi:hypothetical protein